MNIGGNNMKNLITILFVAIISLSVCGCDTKVVDDGSNTGNAEQDVSSEVTIEKVMSAKETPASDFGYEYEEEFGGIVIDDYYGNGGIVVIPEKIEGTDVVRIDDKAFANQDTITAVKLSDTVREIGDQAFINCSGMKIFISGMSLKKIGEFAFLCANLEIVKLNDGLEVLVPAAIVSYSLREIEIPSTVTKMDGALAGERGKTLVVIGEEGSYVEQYVTENGEDWHLEFQVK